MKEAFKKVEPVTRIGLQEANELIREIVGIPFSELLDLSTQVDLKTDKGLVGKLLELKIGLPNSSAKLDLSDGELKTNKCDPTGKPLETIFISQISQQFDEIIAGKPFEESYLWEKIRNLLYVPVCKQGSQSNWFFLPPIVVRLESRDFQNIRNQLRSDFSKIIEQLTKHIENSGIIHTSNGFYIQVRSKDSKPYHPIFSETYQKNISNKNHAFYFRKNFAKVIQQLSTDYPFNRQTRRSTNSGYQKKAG